MANGFPNHFWWSFIARHINPHRAPLRQKCWKKRLRIRSSRESGLDLIERFADKLSAFKRFRPENDSTWENFKIFNLFNHEKYFWNKKYRKNAKNISLETKSWNLLLATVPPKKRNPVHSVGLFWPDFQSLNSHSKFKIFNFAMFSKSSKTSKK